MYGNQRTMVTAAVAAGVLVAAGTAWVGSEDQTKAAPKSTPFNSSVARYAFQNTLYRPIMLMASSGGGQRVGCRAPTVSSSPAALSAPMQGPPKAGGCELLVGCSHSEGGGGTAGTGTGSSPGGATLFGTQAAAGELATFMGGDPAAAVTLVGPMPSPFQIGGLIGGAIAFFIQPRLDLKENPDAGLLFGDGWDSTIAGVPGGRGGLIFGDGGDGADGDVDNPDGSDGGRGGFFGNGGNGGDGFSVVTDRRTPCDRRQRRRRRELTWGRPRRQRRRRRLRYKRARPCHRRWRRHRWRGRILDRRRRDRRHRRRCGTSEAGSATAGDGGVGGNGGWSRARAAAAVSAATPPALTVSSSGAMGAAAAVAVSLEMPATAPTVATPPVRPPVPN